MRGTQRKSDRAFRVLSWLGVALLGAAGIFVTLSQDVRGATALGVFFAVSLGFLVARERVPPGATLLVVLAALVNAAGFAWDLFANVPFYDEAAHLFTPFALTLAIGSAAGEVAMPMRPSWLLALLVAGLGLALAATWEIAEWTASQLMTSYEMRGLDDTISDLVLGGLGAALAAVLLWPRWRNRSGEARAEGRASADDRFTHASATR